MPSDATRRSFSVILFSTHINNLNIFSAKEEKLLSRFHGKFLLFAFVFIIFLDEAEIYSLNNFHEPTSYSFFHLITQLVYSHAQKDSIPRPEAEWTIFLNEQNFLIPENLQLLLQDYDSTRSIVFGRLEHSR
jgi:hypothetical protein